MNYLLTVLTNGRQEYLDRTIAAFHEHVKPMPTRVSIFDDHLSGLGMCAAHAECWKAAAESSCEWVFHLEEDLLILGPIDLRDLREVLDRNEQLAQMALYRTPWGMEIEHGGYIAQTPGWYERKWDEHDIRWFEQTRNWTNAPALYRTQLCRDFPWSRLPGCETEFGPRLLSARPETRFGIWGGGEMHVAHIGVERAEGAHGY